MNPIQWGDSPLFGVTVTLIAYVVALHLQRRWPRLHVLFVCCCLLFLLLGVSGIPYDSYRVGGDLLVFILGPATVALGVPLYKYSGVIIRRLKGVLAGIVAGSLCGMASSFIFVRLAGSDRELLMTLLPKSVTSPISMEIARMLGGIPELAAVLTVLTGLIGSMFGPLFLRLTGIKDDLAIGTAMGTAAHGIGTSRIIRESELQGSAGGFAMGAAGLISTFAAMPIYYWLQP
ncbi:MAG: LrgB family protein [Paenibacillus sp.]|nr:LrgB family protein [Paenibacillus sp.]